MGIEKTQSIPYSQANQLKLKEAAKLYEKQFLGEMVKAMRTTLPEGGFLNKNMAEKIFQEQLDQDYVAKWTDKGGIGLADLIYNQLNERFGAQLGIRAQDIKPQGPLPLNKQSQYRASFFGPTSQNNQLTVKFEKNPNQTNQGSEGVFSKVEAPELFAPWGGRVSQQFTLDNGDQVIEILHPNDLRSRLVFNGKLVGMKADDELQAGQKLGFLSNEPLSFYWNVARILPSIPDSD